MSTQRTILFSVKEWLLSFYSKSPVCVAALLGVLSLLQPDRACARDIDLAEALATIQKPNADFRIIDVRTRAEYEQGHVPGAININIADPNFPAMLRELDKSAPVLVYCRTGRRSGIAVKIMDDMGFSNILHMKDGWIAWEKANMPVDREAH